MTAPAAATTTSLSSVTTIPMYDTNTVAPNYVAVVLAPSIGTRLFPLTSLQTPKHQLPLAGISLLQRLIQNIEASGVFPECVLAINQDDIVTIPSLTTYMQQVETKPHLVLQSATSGLKMTIIKLPNDDDCPGSVEALRRIEKASIIHKKSHIVVLTADLLFLETATILQELVHAHGHHHNNMAATACTVLLADVGEQDEHGVPLKESAKQKKGGLAREDEEIEYMALSYSAKSATPRLVWKQSKLDVEEDKDMIGSTPKVVLPKPRLRHGITKVRTDWNDLHAYAFAPWVRRLVQSRKSLVSIQQDLVPLLISRQYQGIVKTFGSNPDKVLLDDVLSSLDNPNSAWDESENHTTPQKAAQSDGGGMKSEYSVLAHVVPKKSALRCHSIASYLYASKEFVSAASTLGPDTAKRVLPSKASLNAKFHTVLLEGAQVGDKVNFKSCVVGRNVKIGAKCRLNNCVLMDNVTIGENTILQNTIVGNDCTIGENSNLNECQVGHGKVIPASTKEKGESFIDGLDS